MEREKLYEKFFILNFPKVKSFAYKILKSEEDAEDIAQDVFVKLWDHPELWEAIVNADSYIFTMARNRIFNLLKHKQIESAYQEQVSQEDMHVMFGADTYDKIYAEELSLLIKMTIRQMPEQRRKVFLMSRQEGMSNQDIADKLQLSIRTVERHIYLALQEIKKIVFIALFLFS